MKQTVIGKTCLSPLSFGSVCSYELRGDWLIGKLMGCIPVKRVHVKNVRFLRLATRDELSPLYLLLNWQYFLSNRRTISPIYILKTGKHQHVLLKLKGDMHFKLRQVLGRRQEKRGHRVAA